MIDLFFVYKALAETVLDTRSIVDENLYLSVYTLSNALDRLQSAFISMQSVLPDDIVMR